jgi:cell wall-associated NlpC family hydrolase
MSPQATDPVKQQYLEGAAPIAPPPKPIVVKGGFDFMDPLTGKANATDQLFPVPDLSQLTLRNRQIAYITPRVTRVNVSLSTQLQSQVTIDIEDPDFRLLGSGIFQGQPHVNYKGLRLELAGVSTITRGRGAVSLKARSSLVQQLKRRRGPLTIIGDERSFIGYECAQVKLPFVTVPLKDTDFIGPALTKRVSRDWQPYTQQSTITDADEIPSSWTTFKRLADQRGWLLFEANNVLYFAPPSWLFTQSSMVRVRYAPTDKLRDIKWKATRSDERTRAVVVDENGGQYWRTLVATGDFDPGIVDVLEVPVFDHSSDRIETTVSFKIAVKDVLHFLPGKVIDFHGVPYFDGLYLCMGVDYDLTGPDATITAQTPVDPQPQGSSTFSGFGGSSRAAQSVTGVDLSGSGSDSLGLPVCGITFKSFLKGLRVVESGDNYKSPPAAPDAASGGYQYIGSTWRNLAGAAAAQKYPQAYLAPADLQDQVAQDEVRSALRAYDDDWGKVAAHHIYPATAGRPHLWKYRPFMEPGGNPPAGYNPLSNPRIIDYVRKVLKAAGGVMCPTYGGWGSQTMLATDFVHLTLTQVGKPYEQTVQIDYEHTANPAALDCSALVQWGCAGVGVYMPRNSGDQWEHCKDSAINIKDALKVRGALLWIDGGGRAGGEHVAISMGDGQNALAAHTSHAPLDQQINVRSTDASAWSRAALIPTMKYPSSMGHPLEQL